MEIGVVNISGLDTPPEKHELATANYFAELGKDVTFLKPSVSKGIHTPDFMMDGVAWEVKSPEGSSKRTMENNFRNAVMQSKYIIFDLRRTKLDDDYCIRQLKRYYDDRKYLKKLYIIKKSKELVKFEK